VNGGLLVRVILSGSLLLAAACSRGSPSPPASDEPSPPPACETGFTPPEGFAQTDSFTEPYADHLGVRQGFEDDRGRELHVFAGIPGEFGEGLPPGGSVTVATGESAALLGRDQVWALVWDTEGPCSARAVLGNGFGRVEFVDSLREAGIVEDRSWSG
jgi:hypothetical protein